MIFVKVEEDRFTGLRCKTDVRYEFGFRVILKSLGCIDRGGSRAAAASKMERFVIIVNGWKSLTIITKHSILDIAAALDSPLIYLDIISAIFD